MKDRGMSSSSLVCQARCEKRASPTGCLTDFYCERWRYYGTQEFGNLSTLQDKPAVQMTTVAVSAFTYATQPTPCETKLSRSNEDV